MGSMKKTAVQLLTQGAGPALTGTAESVMGVRIAGGEYVALVYYVDATAGNDANTGLSPDSAWQTIGKVNGKTFNPGESVLFKCGETWTGVQLVIPSSGTSGSLIFFGNYGVGANPIIDGTSIDIGWDEGVVEIRTKDYITWTGINIRDADDCSIVIDDGSSNIRVLDSKFYNGGSSGVWAWNSSQITIQGCELDNVCGRTDAQECISISSTTNFIVTDNTVHDVSPPDIGGEGIDAKNGCSSGVIARNTIYNLEDVGIYIDGAAVGCSNIDVYGNYVYDLTNQAHGIAIASELGGDVSALNIYNNILDTCGGGGIAITDWIGAGPIDTVTIYQNTVYDCGSDSGPQGGGIENFDANATNVAVYNNCVSHNESWQIRTANGATITDGGNLVFAFLGAAGEVHGVVEADPLYVNAAAGNFHLLVGSPARGQGVTGLGITTDYDDVARGSPPDIGAYEYV